MAALASLLGRTQPRLDPVKTHLESSARRILQSKKGSWQFSLSDGTDGGATSLHTLD